ncbi:UNVERIFIED_CONTAM: hypothetical protein Slati_0765200 [Sesamum latifolium]|uniref:Uncharacterized protein n=1 Tax=Sesamum latifolium TaxID=2727402 RepID=A0AAW2XR36_9LAMI
MKITWREVAGSQIARLRVRQVADCWLAGRELAKSLAAGLQVTSSPGRLISDLRELRAADHLGE